jgi:hypothetical protein
MNIREFLKKLGGCKEVEIQSELDNTKKLVVGLNNENLALGKTIASLNAKIASLPISNPLEEQLNSKYPKTIVQYSRHETDGDYNIDVRYFINPYISGMPIVSGKTVDEKALACLIWVQNNIKYISDKADYGYEEYWAYPYQTMKRGEGDCEDMHILLYNIMLANGIEYWRMRLNAGDTPVGGHCYLVYYCEEKGYWVCLDSCYYPNKLPINQRVDYKQDKLYGNIWFSWNMKYAFSTSGTSILYTGKSIKKARKKK